MGKNLEKLAPEKLSAPRDVVSAQHPRGASFLIRRWER
jgi:hypothetical protein